MAFVAKSVFFLLVVFNLIVLFGWRVHQPVGTDLLAARKTFRTEPNGKSFPKEGAAPAPPPEIYQFVRYPSGPHKLGAYLTPDPKDGRKRPAIIWAHGGFGGIRDFCWETDDDQSPRAFLNKDFVVMCPSWRGENDNPGEFQKYLGEVDDLLAAVDFVKGLSYVDASRVYVLGYSSSGTLALLAAESSKSFRAAFSIGGAADMRHVLADGKGNNPTPFDPTNEEEVRVRDPMQFLDSLRVPTFYIEGGDSWYALDACKMGEIARHKGLPFQTIIVPGASHWSVLQPACLLIAGKIRKDTNANCNISFTVDETKAIYRETPQPNQR